MKNEFIPVEVRVDNKYDKWYVDISNLGYEKLLSLKNELLGKSYISVMAIDKSVCERTATTATGYNFSKSERFKSIKREKKKTRKKLYGCRELKIRGDVYYD